MKVTEGTESNTQKSRILVTINVNRIPRQVGAKRGPLLDPPYEPPFGPYSGPPFFFLFVLFSSLVFILKDVEVYLFSELQKKMERINFFLLENTAS